MNIGLTSPEFLTLLPFEQERTGYMHSQTLYDIDMALARRKILKPEGSRSELSSGVIAVLETLIQLLLFWLQEMESFTHPPPHFKLV